MDAQKFYKISAPHSTSKANFDSSYTRNFASPLVPLCSIASAIVLRHQLSSLTTVASVQKLHQPLSFLDCASIDNNLMASSLTTRLPVFRCRYPKEVSTVATLASPIAVPGATVSAAENMFQNPSLHAPLTNLSSLFFASCFSVDKDCTGFDATGLLPRPSVGSSTMQYLRCDYHSCSVAFIGIFIFIC